MSKCQKTGRSWTSHVLFKTWSPQLSNQQRTFEEERRGLTGSCTSDGAHRAPSALPLQSRTQNSAWGLGWKTGWNKSQLSLKPTHSPWPAASAQEVLKQVSVRKGCSPKKYPWWNFGIPRRFCLGLGVQLQPGWRTSTLACFRVAVTAMAFKQGCNRNQRKCFAHLLLWCL